MNRTLESSVAPAGSVTRHRWLPRGSAGLRYRIGVAVRAVAAICGGYAVSAMAAAVLALHLPIGRADAALTGTMASFVVYTGAVMWVFAARSAARACLGLVLPALPLGVLLVWHYYGSYLGGAA